VGLVRGHVMIGCGALLDTGEADQGRSAGAGADQTGTRSQVDTIGSDVVGVWCGEDELLS
jgi:hypothetical protein